MSAIRIDRVEKAFKAPVLCGVSLSVPNGCVFALIGPGASGKSVLLKTVAGLIKPDSGTVVVDGAELTSMGDIALAEARRGIGMLFQNYALFDFMTVGENVAFPLRRLFDMSEAEIRERVSERLERVALPGLAERIPSSLSGGQKKRVGVARATVAHPRVLLYDEPTAGLDPVTSQKIYDLIAEEQRLEGSTVMVISSDVTGVLGIAQRVGMLHRGRLVFDGTVEDIRRCDVPSVKQFVHGLTTGPL